MAPARKKARIGPTSFAPVSSIKHYVKTASKESIPELSASGRPVRRAVTRKAAGQEDFVDSSQAISDTDSDLATDDDHSDDGTSIAASEGHISPSRESSVKRARSPSAPLVPDHLLGRPWNTTSSHSSSRIASTPISITVNIPPGFHGPLTIHLDAKDFLGVQAQLPTPSMSPAPASEHRKLDQVQTANGPSSRSTRGKVGLLDLPPEIRNQIYRHVFVKNDISISFYKPNNFDRSSAMLRTCRQVADEGTGILYTECRFFFRRNMSSRTQLWTNSSREIGFEDIHRFLKQIGPANVSRIRHVFFMFEDATPCLNDHLKTNEDRRYVHDKHLVAAIRILADHGRLQTMKIVSRSLLAVHNPQANTYRGFFGRRTLTIADKDFLNEVKMMKADSVEVLARRCHPDWPRLYSNLTWPKITFPLALEVKSVMTRRRKVYPETHDAASGFFELEEDKAKKEAQFCDDCGDVHA